MEQQLITYDIISSGDSPFSFDPYSGLGGEADLRTHRFFPIRGVHSGGVFLTALFGKVVPNNLCTLYLVSKIGEGYSGTQHQHLSYLDANFQAYKDKLRVSGFCIVPLEPRRVSLIESRLPLWDRRVDTSKGEPMFVRET